MATSGKWYENYDLERNCVLFRQDQPPDKRSAYAVSIKAVLASRRQYLVMYSVLHNLLHLVPLEPEYVVHSGSAL